MAKKELKEHEKEEVKPEVVAHDPLLDAPDEPEESTSVEPPAPKPKPETKPAKSHWFKRFISTKKGKIIVAVAAVALVIGLVFAIPVSRYAVAGLVVKKDLNVEIVDSETGKPVSAAQVMVNGQSAKTDAKGKATVHNVPVGPWEVAAKKSYFKDAKGTTLVPILSNQTPVVIKMVATGRQVPVVVTNKISGAALAGVEITAGDSIATTTDEGQATVILPADKPTVSATFKLDKYNTTTADITVTEQPDAKNNFTLTPAGKVYFLSKRTGKINVMKSDLDGANATVAVAGTGKEEETQTVLLASRDWSHLMLQAKRDDGGAKLYLINTADDKLSLIDEGSNIYFTPVGWSNEYFVYQVTRNNVHSWESKRISLKSFNANTGKITTIDDTEGAGSGDYAWANENYTSIYIIGDRVVYGKYWNNYFAAPGLIADKKNTIYSVKSSAEDKKSLKEVAAATNGYLEAVLYRPDEIYFRLGGSPVTFYEYADGKVEPTTDVNDTNYYNQTYATYLVSPSGKYTFWFEQRDGKNIAFIGDAHGANGKEVLSDNDFKPYGWLTDDYLLFSKKGSELFVLPRDNAKKVTPLKITDYHKPAVSFPGYGYGYGGN